MTNQEAITTPASPTGDAAGRWLLVIESPATNGDVDPTASREAAPWFDRRLLGLSIVLRLALSAQAAGARAIVLAPSAERDALRNALRDARLKIPVHDDEAGPESAALGTAVRMPANVVVHRAVLATLGAASLARATRRSTSPDTEEPLTFVPGAPETSALWTAAREAAGPYGFAPIAVTDRGAFDAAERALLRSLRKPQDGWTSTRLNRPISLAITRRLVATSLRPNQVSVAILGVGILGAFLASRGTYASLVAGAVLFHTQSVLDGCDGEMSRLTFRGSHAGEWLDTVGDDLTNYGFFGGAAWGLYQATGQSVYLGLGALTVLCGFIGSGLEYRYLIKIGSGDLLKYPLGIGKAPGPEKAAETKSAIAKLLDGAAPLFKRDTFVFLTLLGAIAGATGPLLAIFAVGAVGVLVAVLKAEFRMARELAEAAEAGRGAPAPSD